MRVSQHQRCTKVQFVALKDVSVLKLLMESLKVWTGACYCGWSCFMGYRITQNSLQFLFSIWITDWNGLVFMWKIELLTSPGYTNAVQKGLKAGNKPEAKQIENVPCNRQQIEPQAPEKLTQTLSRNKMFQHEMTNVHRWNQPRSSPGSAVQTERDFPLFLSPLQRPSFPIITKGGRRRMMAICFNDSHKQEQARKDELLRHERCQNRSHKQSGKHPTCRETMNNGEPTRSALSRWLMKLIKVSAA